MRCSVRTVIFLAVVVCLGAPAGAAGTASPDGLWQPRATPPVTDPADLRAAPDTARLFDLDEDAMLEILARSPVAPTPGDVDTKSVLTLPAPDGSFDRFLFVESLVMAPELAARFPGIRTYAGQGLDDLTATVRFDRTPLGLHAQVLSAAGAYYVEPYRAGDTGLYASFRLEDAEIAPIRCSSPGPDGGATSIAPVPARDPIAILDPDAGGEGVDASGDTLLTYRLAVAATGSYTAYHSAPNPPDPVLGLAAVVTAVNRVSQVYETEAAVHLELVADNDQLIFTPSNDPYTTTDPCALAEDNHVVIKGILGTQGFDVGHVLSADNIGGCAYSQGVCWNARKGMGASGLSVPDGDFFWVGYIAHELGHQFSAEHSWNGTGCGSGQWWSPTAFEPGSGSTIMSYAGLCGADNLQTDTDPYFNSGAYDNIVQFTRGWANRCAVETTTSNGAPTVSAGADVTIPQGTPFVLAAASSSDPDGDVLTFSWEERDLGPQKPLAAPDNGASPLIRVENPTLDDSRTIPRLGDLVENDFAPQNGEQLPTTNRTLGFRLTARDNRAGGGGVGFDERTLTVDAASGPFRVTSPNTAVVWRDDQTITWDVAGTSGGPVGAGTVNILLSLDGGFTYPTVLASGTANDGSEVVTLPGVHTETARIRVEAAGNVFFDISDEDFTILPLCPGVNPCPTGWCVPGSPISSSDTGLGACETATGGTLDCGTGTVHVATFNCTKASCCSAQRPCVCPNFGCPTGRTDLVCQ